MEGIYDSSHPSRPPRELSFKANISSQIVFLVFRGITVAWGICLFFLLPDTPSNAWFLSETDRVGAVNRVKEDVTGVKHTKWKKEQMFEALTDPKVWLAVLIMLCVNIPNGGIGNVRLVI